MPETVKCRFFLSRNTGFPIHGHQVSSGNQPERQTRIGVQPNLVEVAGVEPASGDTATRRLQA